MPPNVTAEPGSLAFVQLGLLSFSEAVGHTMIFVQIMVSLV